MKASVGLGSAGWRMAIEDQPDQGEVTARLKQTRAQATAVGTRSQLRGGNCPPSYDRAWTHIQTVVSQGVNPVVGGEQPRPR